MQTSAEKEDKDKARTGFSLVCSKASITMKM